MLVVTAEASISDAVHVRQPPSQPAGVRVVLGQPVDHFGAGGVRLDEQQLPGHQTPSGTPMWSHQDHVSTGVPVGTSAGSDRSGNASRSRLAQKAWS